MAIDDFFPKRPTATPTIYAIASTPPTHAGLLGAASVRRRAVATGHKLRM